QLAARLANASLNIIDLTKLPTAPTPGQSEAPPRVPPNADDIAVLMYTSGTSGLPKGVLLTYNALQSDVDAAIAHVNLQSRHNFLGIIPLFHAFGMTGMMLAPIQLGSTITYLARFSPVAAVK